MLSVDLLVRDGFSISDVYIKSWLAATKCYYRFLHSIGKCSDCIHNKILIKKFSKGFYTEGDYNIGHFEDQ